MKTEFTINGLIRFNQFEIWIAELSVWGFTQEEKREVTGLDVNGKIKPITTLLCGKLNADSASRMGFHAQQKGFKIDGTLEGEDIFDDKMKVKILKIDPEIEFRFPINKSAA